MTIIKKVSIPFAAVMLGLAALGNLLQSYSEGLRAFCGLLATIFLILCLLKICLYPKDIVKDFENPIQASVAATFPMALMLLATYLKPLSAPLGLLLWWIGVLLHILLIVFFTLRFVLKFDLKKVFSSWYIVYVGIAAASVSAPAFKQQAFGTFAAYFGLVTLIIVLVVVTIRYIKYPVPEPAKPLICIYAAPTSLVIAGYIQSVANKSKALVLVLLVVASILYIFALVQAIRCLALPFYPSYAAFTFPFVISAIATKQTMKMCALPALKPFVLIETIIAVCLVAYTTVRFVQALVSNNK